MYLVGFINLSRMTVLSDVFAIVFNSVYKKTSKRSSLYKTKRSNRDVLERLKFRSENVSGAFNESR